MLWVNWCRTHPKFMFVIVGLLIIVFFSSRLPNPLQAMVITWSQVCGPDTATFTGVSVVDIAACLPEAGAHLLAGSQSPTKRSPLLDAGSDRIITWPDDAILAGTISDDGPADASGVVTTIWSLVTGPGPVVFTDASALDTTVSFSQVGTYVLRLTANDENLTGSDEVSIIVLEAGTQVVTLETRVMASSDDAEEKASGRMSLTSSDLDLVFDDDGNQTVGMRFNGIDIPRGVTVARAYLQFTTDESTSGATSLTIQGEAVDNATTFTGSKGDISARRRITATVSWSPAAWMRAGEAGPAQRTPDITPIIQEIVNRPGWSLGNSLVVFIAGSDKWLSRNYFSFLAKYFPGNVQSYLRSVTRRVAEAYNGDPAGAPLLHVEYIVSDQQPPTVNAGSDQTIVLPAGAGLTGLVSDDGLPELPGLVRTTWSQVSGPGAVAFDEPAAINTTAGFSLAGTYVLRLTANDGELIARDEVTIRVSPATASPTITSLTPISGSQAAVVVVTGSNYSNALEVAFNGIEADFTVVSDGEIHATVPPGATTGPISVTNVTGTGTSTTDFMIVASSPVVVGVGDIASCSRDEDEETAKLLDDIPGLVITLGDNVYPDGTDTEFNDCYEPGWGRHKGRTRPAPGNHDYNTPAASGYFNYFGPAAGEPGQGYYSYDLGGWHIIALNTECGDVGGCGADSPQGQWLQADLLANPSVCTLAYSHEPRFSSGRHGNSSSMTDFWQILYEAGADVVLSGHDHNYERFAPQDPNGVLDLEQGMRQFVVGTGGRGLRAFEVVQANSEVRNNDTFGVLKLNLHPTGYDWEFIPIAGQSFTDSGSGSCHQAPNQFPRVDAGLDQTINALVNIPLDGTIIDGGRPNPPVAVTTTWSLASGPGPVTFANASAVDTTASFPQTGTYVLRLIADDGEFTASDEVTITVIVASVVRVPQDQPTIQAGIDAAQDGDLVLVSPGTYHETLTLAGKTITLASQFHTTHDPGFISRTIIDGGDDTVITVKDSVGSATKIIGFTIQNGDDGISAAGKLHILDNRFVGHSDGIDYEGGGGICRNNLFENNSDDAIDLDGPTEAIIEDNIIRHNDDDGIEIRLHEYSGPTLNIIIRNNIISGNGEDGIQLIDYADLSDRFFLIERNLIKDSAMAGLGLMDEGETSEDFRAASIPEPIHLFNNTFIGNDHGLTGGDNLIALNNLFINSGTVGVKGVDGTSIAAYNLFWNNGTDIQGSNIDRGTTLFVDPLLAGDNRLQAGSPAIDAGTAFYEWQGEPVLDLAGTAYSEKAPDLGMFERDFGPAAD